MKDKLETIEKLREEIDIIEETIKQEMIPKINEYLEAKDYEGAKRFVGKCFGVYDSPIKVLMFRSILLKEKTK